MNTRKILQHGGNVRIHALFGVRKAEKNASRTSKRKLGKQSAALRHKQMRHHSIPAPHFTFRNFFDIIFLCK